MSWNIYDKNKPWCPFKAKVELDTKSSEDTLLKRFLLSSAVLTNLLKEEVMKRALNE